MIPVIASNQAPVIIQFSKVKLALLLLLALGFVALGIWFVLSPSTFGHFEPRKTLVFITGIASIVFFGACAFVILRKLPDSKPGLVLNEDGYADSSSGVAGGLVKWKDITGIRLLTISNQHLLMIHVRNPEEYIERVQGKFKKRMMKLNYKMYGSPLSLSASGLKCSFDELHRLLVINWEHYQ
jgi:hypothetical protein